MGLVGCHCRNWVCVLVLLNPQILLSRSDILLSKILQLVSIFFLQGVHLSLQDDDQRVIIKLLTWGTRHVCWVPLFRGTHNRYPLYGGFLLAWSISLNDSVGVGIGVGVVVVCNHCWCSGQRRSFPSIPWWAPNVLIGFHRTFSRRCSSVSFSMNIGKVYLQKYSDARVNGIEVYMYKNISWIKSWFTWTLIIPFYRGEIRL